MATHHAQMHAHLLYPQLISARLRWNMQTSATAINVDRTSSSNHHAFVNRTLRVLHQLVLLHTLPALADLAQISRHTQKRLVHANIST